jgi:hypothetical protein
MQRPALIWFYFMKLFVCPVAKGWKRNDSTPTPVYTFEKRDTELGWGGNTDNFLLSLEPVP